MFCFACHSVFDLCWSHGTFRFWPMPRLAFPMSRSKPQPLRPSSAFAKYLCRGVEGVSLELFVFRLLVRG